MKKTILFIILSILFCMAGTTAHVHAALVPNKNLEIRIHNPRSMYVRLASVKIEDGPADRYQLVLPQYAYSFFINAESNLNLLRGQVPAYDVRTVIPAGGGAPSAPVYEGPIDPLVMNVPYYDDARFIKIQDPGGRTILTIDLSLYGINTPDPNGKRYADCNVCGFCRPDVKPDDLTACMACLYPNMTPEESLVIDKNTNRPQAPALGKYYSQIGCIGSGASSFREAAAQGEVLNYLMFRFLIPTAGVIAMLALIYGAFILLTSQNNPEQIQRGKSWVYGAIIGAVFVFAAVLIIQTIAVSILAIPGIGK